ncbi:MAG: hypothetical protein B6D58_02425 [candidate division Zixibacteria bacterium 4484_95]|nr:MAG: hypothetical protein B6D58_02425 [candidate division Zixibacteria bacterium 4484_95]
MKKLLGAFIIVSLAVVTGRYVYLELSRLPFFNLSEVEIKCPENIDRGDVLEISGLKIGESIFYQDLNKATDSLLEIRGVQSVKIRRLLPASIRINLETDELVLFVKTDKIYGLTKSQKLLRVANPKNILPVVTGLGVVKSQNVRDGNIKSNMLDYFDKVKLCYAIDVYEEMRMLSENLANRLSEIHFTGSDRIVLYFDPGGVKVLLPLQGRRKALSRLSVLDFNGILGNSGSFDMTGGRMVVRRRI